MMTGSTSITSPTPTPLKSLLGVGADLDAEQKERKQYE